MIDMEQLQRECMQIGVETIESQRESMDKYAAILMEWNEKMNLTAIKKPEEIVTKHFVDSLTLLTAVNLPDKARLIDVGTGAGFPSIPLKIVRADLNITLLDSLNKRITFLKELSNTLEQDNLCVHARAEEAGRKKEYREQYDVATARAVAHLRELTEYCMPFVKVGGFFAALKSGAIEMELSESRRAIQALGGKIETVKEFPLPDGSARTIIVIKKISQTSAKYPRTPGKIAKTPLM